MLDPLTEFGGLVPEAREWKPRRRHLGMDLEGAPENFQRDAPGELRAGLPEADRPDQTPRSRVVAEDLDAHDRYSTAHRPCSPSSLKASVTPVPTTSSSSHFSRSYASLSLPASLSMQLGDARRKTVEVRQTLGDPGRAVVT